MNRQGMKSRQRSAHGSNLPIDQEKKGKEHLIYLRTIVGMSWGEIANSLDLPSPQSAKVLKDSRGSMTLVQFKKLEAMVENEQAERLTKTREEKTMAATDEAIQNRQDRFEAAVKKAYAAGVSDSDIASCIGYKRASDVGRILSAPDRTIPLKKIKKLESNLEHLIAAAQNQKPSLHQENSKAPQTKKKLSTDGFERIQQVINKVAEAKDEWYQIVDELPEDLRGPFIDKGECLQMFLGGLK